MSSEKNNDLYNKKILKTKIVIESNYIDNNIENTIYQKIQDKVSGKCIEEGFVKNNSIKILHISEGIVNLSDLNGNINFDVSYEAIICNPFEKQILVCNVLDINKTTVQAYIEDKEKSPLNLFLTKQHNLNNEEYVHLKIDDKIQIEVLYKNYNYNDKQILVFSKLIKKL